MGKGGGKDSSRKIPFWRRHTHRNSAFLCIKNISFQRSFGASSMLPPVYPHRSAGLKWSFLLNVHVHSIKAALFFSHVVLSILNTFTKTNTRQKEKKGHGRKYKRAELGDGCFTLFLYIPQALIDGAGRTSYSLTNHIVEKPPLLARS